MKHFLNFLLIAITVLFVSAKAPFIAKSASSNSISSEEEVASEMKESQKKENRYVPSSIISDFSEETSKGSAAWDFFYSLGKSKTFIDKFWQKKPLVLRSDEIFGGWLKGAFTVEKDLRLVGDSFISGYRTSDILRNGTKTDTWQFVPLKDDPTRRTTWEQVECALKGGTIYFNTAGSLWPNVGALCRLAQESFGIPCNINIYITPPEMSVSVPPHTDKQDVFVLQTSGSKHWKVFAPPKRKPNVDPLNRGKNNDVLSFSELGPPLIDTILNTGDILYIPHGCPHITNTAQQTNYTSIHLTLGLDTHVWYLTFAHLRWCLLQRVNKQFALKVEREDVFWKAMEAIPVGFLCQDWDRIISDYRKTNHIDSEYVARIRNQLKQIMSAVEPNRWIDELHKENTEQFPSDEDFNQVIEFVVSKHLLGLLSIQDEMFRDVDPHSEESLIKAFQGSQKHNDMMEQYGRFCGNQALVQHYARLRQKRDATVAAAIANK